MRTEEQMSESASAGSHSAAGSKKQRGVFARIALFIRQIIAELRKVVRPSRDELWTYFIVVIVFVAAMMAFVGLLDFLFGQLVLLIFG